MVGGGGLTVGPQCFVWQEAREIVELFAVTQDASNAEYSIQKKIYSSYNIKSKEELWKKKKKILVRASVATAVNQYNKD